MVYHSVKRETILKIVPDTKTQKQKRKNPGISEWKPTFILLIFSGNGKAAVFKFISSKIIKQYIIF